MAKQKVKSQSDKGRQRTAIQKTAIIEENKYVVFGLLGIFLLLVFFAASYKVSGDDDFFWHLATGRYIVENMVVPDKDVFGHITSGTQWIPFEWGWDVLTYGLYNVGGYNAILGFRSFIFCVVFFILFMLLRKFKVNTFLSALMLFLLLISIMDRFSPRPHILTYLFFVSLLFIILNYKYLDREKYSRLLYLVPVIFLVWSNTHMGVLAGGLVLFIFTITETIIHYKPGSYSTPEIKPLDKTQLKRLWILSVICAFVLLVNPHGFSTYIYAYEHTKMKLLDTVNEWQSPFTDKMDFGITLALYKFFLFSGIMVLFYSFRKKDLLFTLMFIGFAIYSVRAIRFTVDYNIVMIFFIIISFNYLLTRIKDVKISNFLNGNVLKAVAALAFIYTITLIPNNKIYEKMQYYRMSGWGVDDQFIPVQMFEFMKQNNISGTPYNHFGTGGYLVWSFPGEKNFIDSRNLNDEIFGEYNSIMGMAPGFERKLEERGVDYIVYLDPDLIRRPNDLKRLVTSYFARSSKWKLVFWDDKSMLFLKNIEKFSDVINRYEYRIMNPYTFMFHKPEFESGIRQDPGRAKEELKRKHETEPGGFLLQNLNQLAGPLLQ